MGVCVCADKRKLYLICPFECMSMRMNFVLAMCVCVCAEEYLANKHRIEHLPWYIGYIFVSSLSSFTHEVNNSKSAIVSIQLCLLRRIII